MIDRPLVGEDHAFGPVSRTFSGWTAREICITGGQTKKRAHESRHLSAVVASCLAQSSGQVYAPPGGMQN